MKKFSLLFLALSLSASADNVLRRGIGSEPRSIDPQLGSESAGSIVMRDIFEGLTTTTQKGEIIPAMAESWTVSEDGKTYTFKIREDAKWSDGSALTAHDFVYGWQRAVNPETASEYSFILFPVKNAQAISEGKIKDLNELGAKALDDRTFEVTLESTTPYFLGLITHYTAYPVPKKVVEKHGNKWTHEANIVSNGAFKVTSWRPHDSIEAVKSEHYWDKANVKLDKVIYYPIEEDNAELKRYRAGELDITVTFPIDQLEWAKKNLADELKLAPKLATYWFNFNLDKEPFKSNPKLREALSLAVDRKIMVEKITRGGQIPAYSIVPPGVENSIQYKSPNSELSREEQIAKAKKLYEEAGYSKDKPLKVTVTYNTSESHKAIVTALAAMWKQVLGVETVMENQEWKVMLDNVRQGNYEVSRYAWIGDYNDPYTFLEIFRSGIDMNQTKFSNKEYDELLDKSATILDLEERAKVLSQAEAILTETYPVIPLYHYTSARLVKPYVKGYESNLLDNILSKYMSIEK